MPGDGVSLPTSLAQLGNVAKTQAKGQQSAPQVTPFSAQKEGQEELKVQRVKESTAPAKNRVTRQDEEKDKRKRRRLKRKRKKADLRNQEDGSSDADNAGANPAAEKLGALIDLRV